MVLGLIPLLAGYRHTLNGSGAGLYVEPNAGYKFVSSSIEEYDAYGQPVQNSNDVAHIKLVGPAAGLSLGYLFDPRGIQFNLSLHYEHSFGHYPVNTFSFRIAYAFTFDRRNNDYQRRCLLTFIPHHRW